MHSVIPFKTTCTNMYKTILFLLTMNCASPHACFVTEPHLQIILIDRFINAYQVVKFLCFIICLKVSGIYLLTSPTSPLSSKLSSSRLQQFSQYSQKCTKKELDFGRRACLSSTDLFPHSVLNFLSINTWEPWAVGQFCGWGGLYQGVHC